MTPARTGGAPTGEAVLAAVTAVTAEAAITAEAGAAVAAAGENDTYGAPSSTSRWSWTRSRMASTTAATSGLRSVSARVTSQ